jgi:hypothetical protein
MSEPQNEYDTEHEIDAEPTPGPARVSDGTHVRAHPEKAGMDTEIIMGPSHHGNDLPQEEQRANAELTSAAFTAAQEVKEMGYDPVAVQKALPKILSAAEELLERVEDDCRARNINPYDEPSFTALEYALASAEGSDNE